MNEGYNPEAEVVISRQDAQEILSALSWAFSYFKAQDLATAYKDGRDNVAPTKITLALTRAYDTLERYVLNDELQSLQ